MRLSPRRIAAATVAAFAVTALVTAGVAFAPAAPATAATTSTTTSTTSTSTTTTASDTTSQATGTSTLPTTVSDDVLPTPQINGVVWSVAVVGTTAYAVGKFTAARPSGSAAGVNEVTRNNAMAFNVTTGAILAWNPNLNAQARSVEVSPDGSTLYVGGDFSTVGSVAKSKIAAFTVSTGALQTGFAASISGSVWAIAPETSTVYVVGSFGTASGKARANAAAFTVGTGALTAWAPQTDGITSAVVAAADGSRVVLGGKFQNLNGAPIVGIGAVDGTTGATQVFNTHPITAASGDNYSYVTDMTLVNGVIYAAADGEGANWFDGRFATTFATGDLVWLDNCYGATYGSAVIGQVAYEVSHSHDCTSVGAFPEQTPRINKRATADTIYATGTDQGAPSTGSIYSGQPVPTQLPWYPLLAAGTFTGQTQGAWSIGTASSTSKYLVLGGEFPSVNGVAQQGLATFATRDIAPNKIAPVYSTALTPQVLSLSSGTARVAFTGTYDQDDGTLTYNVLRDNSLTPITSITADSRFWKLPALGYTDTGLVPGSSHTYRVQVVDPEGNSYIGPRSSAVTVSSAAADPYEQAVKADGASDLYTLGESSGTVVYDHAGFADADASGGVSRNGDSGPVSTTATTFDGSSGTVATRTAIQGPNTFTTEAWFKTTSTSGGKIVGFGNAQTGNSSNYDRHVYLSNTGQVSFGVYTGDTSTITSGAGYNDGKWHLVTASLGANGMTLSLDGIKVASRPDVTAGQNYLGYWRIGGDSQTGWPNSGSSDYLAGDIADVAIYPTVLSPNTVLSHWTASGRTSTAPTSPTDTYGKTVFADSPDIYWRLDDTGTGVTPGSSLAATAGNVSNGVTRGVPGVLSTGSAYAFDGSQGSVISTTQVNDPTVYSTEAWFKTTTTSGGKIIGFGNASSGTSSNYDRHVFMQDDGTLVFGTYNGGEQRATSTASYNDGAWHQVVATQSSAGMVLYVDGVAVATNANTTPENDSGYWRIGGDNVWGGASSAFFAGTIDEAAVYPTALTAAQVSAHYSAGSGTTVTPPPPANVAPTAAFTATPTALSVAVDGTASTDSDGTVSSYAWDFGDGGTATGSTAQHAYAAAGTYTVTLTVTDDKGLASAPVTHSVTVTAPVVPNAAPTAAFTPTTTGLSVAVDGTASSDSDGTVASYAWNFGDGTTATGSTAQHTYATAGSYTITLVVTDDKGLASTATTKSVTVTAPVTPPTSTAYATDTFTRSVTNGWGNADLGGAWTTTNTASNFSVSGSQGLIKMATAGANPSMYLGSVSSTDTETRLGFGIQSAPTGAGVYASILGRNVVGAGDYRTKVTLVPGGGVLLALFRTDAAGNQTVLGTQSTIAGLTYTPGMTLDVRMQVVGTSPTTINAKVWDASKTEPTAWMKTATDSTAALQAPGRVGINSYLSSTATAVPVVSFWDDLWIGKTGN